MQATLLPSADKENADRLTGQKRASSKSRAAKKGPPSVLSTFDRNTGAVRTEGKEIEKSNQGRSIAPVVLSPPSTHATPEKGLSVRPVSSVPAFQLSVAPSPDTKDLQSQLSVLRCEYRKKVEATCQLIRRLTANAAPAPTTATQEDTTEVPPALAAPPAPSPLALLEARVNELAGRCSSLEAERDDLRGQLEAMTADNEEAEEALMELWQLVQQAVGGQQTEPPPPPSEPFTVHTGMGGDDDSVAFGDVLTDGEASSDRDSSVALSLTSAAGSGRFAGLSLAIRQVLTSRRPPSEAADESSLALSENPLFDCSHAQGGEGGLARTRSAASHASPSSPPHAPVQLHLTVEARECDGGCPSARAGADSVTQLRSMLKELQGAHKVESDRLRDEVEQLRVGLEDASLEIKHLHQSETRSAREVEGLQTQLRRRGTDLEARDSLVKTLQAQVKDRGEAIRKLKTELSSTLSDFESQVGERDSLLQLLGRQNEGLKDSLRLADSAVTRLQGERDLLMCKCLELAEECALLDDVESELSVAEDLTIHLMVQGIVKAAALRADLDHATLQLQLNDQARTELQGFRLKAGLGNVGDLQRQFEQVVQEKVRLASEVARLREGLGRGVMTLPAPGLEKEVASLRADLESTRSRLVESQHEVHRMSARLGQSHKDLASAETELAVQLVGFETRARVAEGRVQDLEQKLAGAEALLGSVREEAQEREAHSQALSSALESAREMALEKGTEVQRLGGELAESAGALKKAHEDFGRVASQLDEAMQSVHALRQSVSELEGEKEGIAALVEDKALRMGQLEMALGDEQRQVRVTQAALEAARGQLADEKAVTSLLQAQLSRAEGRVTEVTQELALARESAARGLADLVTRMEALEVERACLAARCSELVSAQSSSDEKLVALEGQVAGLQALVGRKEAEARELDGMLGRSARDLKEWKERALSSEAEVEGRAQEVAQLSSLVSALQTEMSTAKLLLQQNITAAEELQENRRASRSDLAASQRRVQGLESDLGNSRVEAQALKHALSSLAHERDALAVQLAQATNLVEDLQRELGQLARAVSRSTGGLHTSTSSRGSHAPAPTTADDDSGSTLQVDVSEVASPAPVASSLSSRPVSLTNDASTMYRYVAGTSSSSVDQPPTTCTDDSPTYSHMASSALQFSADLMGRISLIRTQIHSLKTTVVATSQELPAPAQVRPSVESSVEVGAAGKQKAVANARVRTSILGGLFQSSNASSSSSASGANVSRRTTAASVVTTAASGGTPERTPDASQCYSAEEGPSPGGRELNKLFDHGWAGNSKETISPVNLARLGYNHM